ncbi:MAG: LTA synthase family protein [Ruminococcus sp.]|jgi:hypothetical protein|nr:LTA synthase family protein [Ruminococcus sp.]
MPKEKKFTLACVIIVLVLTYAFFQPLDLYLRNSTSFMVGIDRISIPFGLISLALCALLYFPLSFLKDGKAVDIIILVLFGFTVSSYVQLLFLNYEMGAMTGAYYNYSELTSTHMSNFGIFILIMFEPLLIVFYLKSKKKKADYTRVVSSVSAVLLLMQLAGVISVIPSYTPIIRTPLALSYSKSFEMSSDENIVVFVVDRLDNKFTYEAFERYPDSTEIFDGFTFYEDNTSVYSCTVPSIAYMMTGDKYNNEIPVYSYLRECWTKDSFIDELHNSNFAAYMLLDRFTAFTDVSDLSGKADNIKEIDNNADLRQDLVTSITFRISASKLMPYLLKDAMLNNISEDFQNDYLNMTDTDAMDAIVGFNTDMRFYDNLIQNGLTLQDEKNVFSVIHLRGAHDMGTGYDNGFIREEGFDNTDSAYASFKIIEEYLNQMKNLGIYDDATVIVIADHGNSSLVQGSTIRLYEPVTSTLLIKPKGADGPMKYNDTAELSHEYFGASILEYAGIPHEEFGLSYQDVESENIKTTRRLYLESWVNVYNLKSNGYYEINGDARDFSNWVHY